MPSDDEAGAPQSLGALRKRGFDVKLVSHAGAILAVDFPEALQEIGEALNDVRLPVSEIIGSGGGETKFTQRLRKTLAKQSWRKHVFIIGRTIDGVQRDSTSHEVDHVKRFDRGAIALEIEWNNKDPFFDRDLESFKRLHAEGAISLGVLITRGASLQHKLHEAVMTFAKNVGIHGFDDLQRHGYAPTPKQRASVMKRVQRTRHAANFADAWVANFVANKFGPATTHWAKLIDRIDRGVGNPCPLLLIGLPASMIEHDRQRIEPLAEEEVEGPGAA